MDDMKNFNVLILTLVLLLLASCSRAPRTLVNPEWTSKASSYTVVYTEPYIVNQSDFDDDFFDDKEGFAQWFARELSTNLTKLSGIQPQMQIIAEDSLATVAMEYYSNETINVPFPRFAENFQGIVFYIHPIRTNRYMDACYRSRCNSLPNNAFIMSGQFTVLDISTKKILAYGDISSAQTFHFALTKSDWENAVKEMAKNMLENTPLLIE